MVVVVLYSVKKEVNFSSIYGDLCILKCVIEDKEGSFVRQKNSWIPVFNLITEFYTDKESMYSKFKEGNELSFRITTGSGLVSNSHPTIFYF